MSIIDVLFLISAMYCANLLCALTMRVYDRIQFASGMRKAKEQFELDKKEFREAMNVVPFNLQRQRGAN